MLRAAGLLACGAALACVAGDLALQYTPNTRDLFASDYRYLAYIPDGRLLLGHYLGVLALPLQLAGMWLVYQALLPAGRRFALPVALLGIYSVAAGPALHSMFAVLAQLVQAQAGAPPEVQATLGHVLQRTDPFVNPLGAVILASVALTSVGYAVVVGFMFTRLPRWMALCNPPIFLVVGGLLTLAIPEAALVVVPAGLNLAHLCFYALLTLLLWNAKDLDNPPLSMRAIAPVAAQRASFSRQDGVSCSSVPYASHQTKETSTS
jgi:hypothetical protein